jgi:hypothetical protein
VLLSTKSFLKKESISADFGKKFPRKFSQDLANLLLPDSSEGTPLLKTDLQQSSQDVEDILAETPKKSLRASTNNSMEEISIETGFEDLEPSHVPQNQEQEESKGEEEEGEMSMDPPDDDTDTESDDSEEGAEEFLTKVDDFETVDPGQTAPARAQLLADFLKAIQTKASQMVEDARVQFVNFADAAAFEKSLQLQLTAKDIKLTEEEKGMLIDLRPCKIFFFLNIFYFFL